MFFSMLQRYVLSELLKVFLLTLSALTIMLMFVGVMGEAMKKGLGPVQILQILPYIVPSLLPFTMPATLLFTVCVVYGRLAGDQELTAVKAAGISVMSMIWPSIFLGGVLSVCTLILTDQFIPWARANIQRTIAAAMEDIFLDMLRSRGNIDDMSRGFSISVMGIEGKRLINPTFRYTPGGGDPITIHAESATLDFDLEHQEVVLNLRHGHLTVRGKTSYLVAHTERIPLPSDTDKTVPREMTVDKIHREMQEILQSRSQMEQRRFISTALTLTSGDFDHFLAPDFNHYAAMLRVCDDRLCRLNTEVHSRYALSCSCFFFVLLGSPYSILQGKRQFLTSFFLCFLPILVLYYPLIMLCMNLAKTNPTFDPAWTMWTGNALIGCVGLLTIHRLMKN